MKILTALLACSLVALGLTASSCKSAHVKDINVESEANPKVKFDGYKSYAWFAAAAVVNDPDGQWTLPDLDVGAEIQHVTDRELRGKGWTEVASSPDVLVMYAVGVDMKALDVVMDKDDKFESIQEVPKGALMLIMADPETRTVMWVGMADGKITKDMSLDIRKERLDYAITQMIKKSPI